MATPTETPRNAISRLKTVLDRLSLMRGNQHELLRAIEYDHQLDELADTLDGLQQLSHVMGELDSVETYYETLLTLFGSAHNKDFDGGSVECLIRPAKEKLMAANRRFDILL